MMLISFILQFYSLRHATGFPTSHHMCVTWKKINFPHISEQAPLTATCWKKVFLHRHTKITKVKHIKNYHRIKYTIVYLMCKIYIFIIIHPNKYVYGNDNEPIVLCVGRFQMGYTGLGCTSYLKLIWMNLRQRPTHPGAFNESRHENHFVSKNKTKTEKKCGNEQKTGWK